MILASVSKLNIYSCPIFDRVKAEFDAAQEEGLISLDLDVKGLEREICMDFMFALEDLGYNAAYSEDEEVLEVWFE